MAPSSFAGAARWAQRAHSTDGQNTGGAAEGARGLALALRTARCQNKTGRSFPRRRPNSSQRQLGARDFEWRRTGCLAGAAGRKQRLSARSWARSARAACAAASGEWTHREAGAWPGLSVVLGNVPLLVQSRKRVAWFPCAGTDFRMRSCFAPPWGLLGTEPHEMQLRLPRLPVL